MKYKKHLIVLASPSGGGKSTVARHLLKTFPQMKFSISATTRQKRPREIHGKDYYFITKEEFLAKISANELVEYEEIFGNYYGTLKSTIDKAINEDSIMLFDIDVKGAISLKKLYPEESNLIFILPPDLQTLQLRLAKRGTETEEQINNRLSRAKLEIAEKDKFDFVILNEVLETTLSQAESIVKENFNN
jgi:guanylate kinase